MHSNTQAISQLAHRLPPLAQTELGGTQPQLEMAERHEHRETTSTRNPGPTT